MRPVVTLCLAVVAAAQTGEQARGTDFSRGVELQKKGDLDGARLAYEAAVRANPANFEALANLGTVLLQSGKDAEAAATLARALKLRPGLDSVRTFYGLALFRSGNTDAAAAEAEAVLARQPKSLQGLHLLGLCRLRQDRFAEGIAALAEVVRAAPGNLSAAATLATVYAGSGRIAEAEALLEGPLGSSARPEAYLVRGVVDKTRGEWIRAVRALEEAARLNPKLPTVHTELGHAYLLTGDGERAEKNFLAELEARPEDFHATLYLGWLYLQRRQYDRARSLLEVALRQKPLHASLLHMMGQAEWALGHWEKARETLELALEQKPDLLAARVLLARVYAKLRRTEDLRRQQAMISELTRQEQERNLLSKQTYGGNQSQSMPELDRSGVTAEPR